MSGSEEWNGKSFKLILKILFQRIKFSESLFGCFDDWSSCCYGYWCLPCLFGTNAEKINDQNCCLMCCAYSCLTSCYLCWLPHIFERKALREKHGLREDSTCGDIPATICCGPCAICQESREMKLRGI